nr:integrase, catalytic region, zinc finger, CCHC-type, peptidase aspartic, catalytic [Tanacetum cinerariifolium]
DYLKHLKESVATLYEIVEEAKATTPLNRKKQVTFVDQCETSNTNTQKHVEEKITQKTNVLVLPSTGVDSCTDASGSKPKRNTKKNRILPAKNINKKTVEDHSRTNKSHLQKPNRVDSSISSKRCSKHMTGDRSWLKNFVKKFNGTVRFRNDHFGAIMGEKLLLLLVISKTVPSFTLVITKPHMIWTRSYISDALTDKYRARTKSGSCNTLCTPTNKDMEILFQLMFDEYLELPRVDRPVSLTSAVTIPINSAGLPTAIDQDAPSPSHSPSSLAL